MGDSFTEGIGDPEPASPGGHRGWADRVAEELSRGHDDFAYANLAVRGRLLQQIVDQQLAHCLSLQPDLVTLSAGGNDLIRPGGDPDVLAERLDSVVQILSMGGATVVLFNGPDTGLLGAGPDPQQGGHLQREPAHRGGPARRRDRRHVVPAPAQRPADVGRGPAALLAAGPPHHRGHGAGFAERAAHPGAAAAPSRCRSAAGGRPAPGTSIWAREHFVPWVVRRLRHRSSGDGITAKRPLAGPVFGPGVPLGSGEGPPGAEDALRS